MLIQIPLYYSHKDENQAKGRERNKRRRNAQKKRNSMLPPTLPSSSFPSSASPPLVVSPAVPSARPDPLKNTSGHNKDHGDIGAYQREKGNVRFRRHKNDATFGSSDDDYTPGDQRFSVDSPAQSHTRKDEEPATSRTDPENVNRENRTETWAAELRRLEKARMTSCNDNIVDGGKSGDDVDEDDGGDSDGNGGVFVLERKIRRRVIPGTYRPPGIARD